MFDLQPLRVMFVHSGLTNIPFLQKLRVAHDLCPIQVHYLLIALASVLSCHSRLKTDIELIFLLLEKEHIQRRQNYLTFSLFLEKCVIERKSNNASPESLA